MTLRVWQSVIITETLNLILWRFFVLVLFAAWRTNIVNKVGEAVFWNIDLLKLCSIRYMQPAHYSYVFEHEKVIFALIFEIPSTIYLLHGIFMPKFPEIGQNFNKNPIS